MVTLENTTKSVKVLKAIGMPTLRIIPGFNYVDVGEEGMKKYAKSSVNRAIIKESIKLVAVELSDDEKEEAQAALEKNEKLNKAQKVIQKQNEQILAKDKTNDDQAATIKELTDANAEMAEAMKKMQKQLEKLEKKDKK